MSEQKFIIGSKNKNIKKTMKQKIKEFKELKVVRKDNLLFNDKLIKYFTDIFVKTQTVEDYVNILTDDMMRQYWFKKDKDNYIIFNLKWLEVDSNGFRSWISKILTTFLKECRTDKYGTALNKISEEKYKKLYMKFGNLNSIQSLISSDHPDNYKHFNKQKNVILFNDSNYYDMKTKEVKELKQHVKMTIEIPFNSDIIKLTDKDEFCSNYFESLFSCKDTAQRMIDIIYTAISGNKLRYLITLWGKGRNGKSIFLNLLDDIFSHWSGPVSDKIFIEKKIQTTHNDEMVAVCKQRIGHFAEPPRGSVLCEDAIKRITGDDGIIVRDLGKTSYKDKPTATLFLACNTPPTFSSEGATQDRLIAFHFCNRFEKDSEYEENLKKHYPYILSYILRTGNLVDNPKPTENMDKAKEYIEHQSDVIEQYILESGDYEKDESGVFNQALFKKDITEWVNYMKLDSSDRDKIKMRSLYETLDKKGYPERARTAMIKKPRTGLKRLNNADIEDYGERFG